MPNTVVQIHRKEFPDDTRTDDELTREYAQEYGDYLSKEFPDFASDVRRLQGLEQVRPDLTPEESERIRRELYPPTAGDYARHAIGTFGRAAAAGIAGIPEAIAVGSRVLQKAVTGEATPIEELATHKLGETIKSVAETITPAPVPDLEKSFVATTVPAALGSSAAFMAGGVAGRVAKIPQALAIATTGAMVNAADAYHDAIKSGASEDKAFESFLLNGGVGTSEALPLARILKRLDGISGGTLKKALIEAGRDSLEEALQESLQGIAGNVIARNIVEYDKDRKLFDTVLEQGGAGGIVGATLSLLSSAIGAKIRPIQERKGKEVTTVPAPSDGLNLAERYETKRQEEARKTAEATATITSVAQNELAAGGLNEDDLLALSKLTPEQRAEYSRVKEQLRKEATNATNEGPQQQSGEQQHLGTAAQLQAEEENRQRQAEEQRAREANRNRHRAAISGAQQQVLAPVVEIEPFGEVRQFRATEQFTNPADKGVYKKGDVISEGQLAHGGFAVPPLIQPVNLRNLYAIARDYVDRLVNVASPTDVQKQNLNMVHAMLQNPTQAAPENLSAFFGLRLNEQATAMPDRYRHVPPIAEAVPSAPVTAPVTAPVVAPIPELNAARAAATAAAIGTTVPVQAKVATERARATAAVVERQKTTTLPPAVASPAPVAMAATVPPVVAVQQAQTEVATVSANEGKRSAQDIKTELVSRISQEIESVRKESGVQVVPREGLENEYHVNDAKGTWLVNAEITPTADGFAVHAGRGGESVRFDADTKEEAIRKLQAWYSSASGKVTIEIPGDGTFTVYRNGRTLSELLQRAERIKTSTEPKTFFPRGAIKSSEGALSRSATEAPKTKKQPGKLRIGDQGGYNRSSVVTAKWTALLDVLALRGVPVQVFEQHLDGVTGLSPETQGFFQRTGGGLSDNGIALVVSDITHPTHEDFVAALHESAHEVFANESPQMQEALHRAIDSLSDAQLGIQASQDPRISQANVAGLDPETLAEERLVESFAQQGFDPTQSRGLAQALWRFIKDLYYRASMALQQAFFGPEHVRPERVREYFDNRVRQFLSNYPSPMDFLSFLGGGKPTAIRQAMFYKPHDHSFVPVLLDWSEGRVVYQDLTPSTVAAALLNIENSIREQRAMFRTPGTVSGPEVIGGEGATVRASMDFAANKKLSAILHAGFDQVNAAGLNQTTTGEPLSTYEAFFDRYKGDLESPETIMAKAQADLAERKQPAFDPNIGLDGPVRFKNEFTVRQVQSKTLSALQKFQAKLSEEYQNATHRIRGTQKQLETMLSRQDKLAGNYQDLAFHFENVKEAIGSLIKDFKSDLGDQLNLTRKFGVLAQSVKALQREQNAPIPGTYETLINRMSRLISGNEDSFMDFLRSVSQLDIDWENTPLASKGDVVGIRDLASGIADANALFKNLDAGERDALMAIVASFAKQNDHVMAWLAVREANDHEAASAIKEALAQARKETNADLRDARALINRVPRMAVRADRIFRKYLEARQEAQRLNDSLQKDTKYISAYQELEKVLGLESQKLEKALSGNEPDALTDGEKLPYVASPTDTPEMIRQHDPWEYRITGDHQATPAEVMLLKERYNAWLENNRGAGGVMWNRINSLVKRLELLDVGKGQVAIRRSFLNKIFGSLADAVNGTGTPAGRAIGQMLSRYSTLATSYDQQHAALGYKIINAAGKAMKEMGLSKRPEMFYDLFHDQAFKYFENRRDLQEAGTSEQATEAVLNAVRSYFGAHPQTGKFMTPRGWDALRNYYLLNAQQTGLFAKTAKEMGIQVRDENLGFFRDPLGQPLFTHPRGMNASLEALFGGPGSSLREAWGGTRWPKLTAEDVTTMLNQEGGIDKLKALLGPRFTPDVWSKFVKPLAYRPGRSVFNGRRLGDGSWKIADVSNVRLAFDNAGGDPIAFATGLAQLEGVSPDMVNEFVGETFDTFQKFYDSVEHVMKETEAFKAAAGISASVPRYLMDARISEEWPAEWLSYQRYDQNTARNIVHLMAYHASFGRNGEAAFKHFGTAENELSHAANQWQEIIHDMEYANPQAGRLAITGLARSEASRRGLNWRFLENAESHERTVRNTRTRFIEWFKTQTSDLVETKTLFESVGTLAGFLVQGPKTALINTMDMIAGPVLQVGLNRRALDQIRRNWQSFATSVYGSLVQQVGITTQLNAENMQRRNDLGYFDPATMVSWKERLKAELAAPIAGGVISRGLTRATRLARTFTHVGIPTPTQTELSARLKPQAAFTQIGQWMNHALIDGVWCQYEDMALRAKEYLLAHPEAIRDPKFQFTYDMLGYPKSLFSDKSFAFDSLKEGLNRWGMTIEGIGRSSLKEGASLFSEEQYRNLASMALNELSLESGPSTRPAWFHNPVIRFVTPLLGWSFSKTAQLRKAFREPGGEVGYYAAARGMAMMFGAMLPIGLLYGLLMQKYDEKLLGKKSNIRGFGQDNNVLAAMEQLARVGTFGFWGDLGNTIGNAAGQGDLRGLSVDNRVIFVNSLLNAFYALTTFIKQGEATYATVYRPLLQATGGSGYLQYAQALNNFVAPETTGGLPLIGQFLENERRVTSRINVGNWLRSVGREMNLDVRMGRGGQTALPNTIKPWVSSMLLDSLADDMLGFQADYQNALQAAREEGKPDPVDHVKRSFQSYHPLSSAFRTMPSEAEYHQMLARLPEPGRGDVQTAINLYKRYASTLGIKEREGKEEPKPKHPKQWPSIEALRRRALGKMFDLPTFTRN